MPASMVFASARATRVASLPVNLSVTISEVFGCCQPNKVKVGSITRAQLKKLAEIKMPDLNTESIDSAIAMMAGAARSMGITVKD